MSLKHKGYVGRVEFDPDADILHGEVVGIRDVVTFQGSSVAEVKQAFRESVEDYLEFCRNRGEEPEKPYSGRFVVRVKPELHRGAAAMAAARGASLNAVVAECLAVAVGEVTSKVVADATSPRRRKRRRASRKA